METKGKSERSGGYPTACTRPRCRISLSAYIRGRCAVESRRRRRTNNAEQTNREKGHFVCKFDSALNKILTDQSRRVAGVEAREPPSTSSFPRAEVASPFSFFFFFFFFHYLSRRHHACKSCTRILAHIATPSDVYTRSVCTPAKIPLCVSFFCL